MIQLTGSSVFNFWMIGFVLLSFKNCPTVCVAVTPCSVQNMLIQPRFGISAKTRNLIEVIQAPPHLTQTIQIGVCANTNSSFVDSSSSPVPNLPNYICRQRYSAVEVYSKINQEKLNSLKSLQNILKVPTERRLPSDMSALVKDLLLVEAGCNIFFNYLPNSYGATRGSNINLPRPPLSPSRIGVSDINLGKPPDNYNSQKTSNHDFIGLEPSVEFKQSDLKQRSPIRNDFFRKGFHLRALTNPDGHDGIVEDAEKVSKGHSEQATSNPLDNTTFITVQQAGSLPEFNFSQNHRQINEPANGIKVVINDTSEILEDPIGIVTSTMSSEEEKEGGEGELENISEEVLVEEAVESYGDDSTIEEHPINSEDIGLPIIFLDSSVDPIMRLISSVELESD